MANYYLWFKAFHVISIVIWMSSLLYLPKLYADHTKVILGTETDKIFQLMEYRLLKMIMNPAMISTYSFGLISSYIRGVTLDSYWFPIKMISVVILTILHMLLANWRKDFVGGKNNHSKEFYQIISIIVAFSMIIAIFMAVVKPFN